MIEIKNKKSHYGDVKEVQYHNGYTIDNFPNQIKGINKIEYDLFIYSNIPHAFGDNIYDKSKDIVKITVYIGRLKKITGVKDFNKISNGINSVFLMETICVANKYDINKELLLKECSVKELSLCRMKTNDGFCQYNDILRLIDGTKEFMEELTKQQKAEDGDMILQLKDEIEDSILRKKMLNKRIKEKDLKND